MRSRWRTPRTVALLLAGALALAACSSSPGHQRTTTTTARHGTTTTTTGKASTTTPTTAATSNVATFAEPPGQTPDFIAPITPTGFATTTNTAQFSALMWRPLIWPGTGEQLGPNPAKSLYSSIKYNGNDTSVTITLKNWDWSDGQPVTARDLTFFLNLVTANRSAWSAYVPGQLPDNIASAKATGERTLVLKLKGSWSPFFFTDDELSLLTPLPQQAWDKESTTGKVGNYDQTTAGAKAVWAYLVSQAQDTATFATNPLWKTVDGPWELQSFGTGPASATASTATATASATASTASAASTDKAASTTASASSLPAGEAVFVPNPTYSGSDAPTLARFEELPFANGTDEVDALAAGQVDVGYLPSDLLADRAVLNGAGFTLTPWVGLDLAGIIPNLTNPSVAPLLEQTYIRESLEELVDQPALVNSVYQGYASYSYGPIPLAPANNPYASPAEMADPYSFSVSAATALLASHGWQASAPGTAATCVDPSACGAGITKGEPLTLDLTYPTGNTALAEELEVVKSAAIQAGVVVNLSPASPASFAKEVKPCATRSCSWQLATYQGYPYSIEPTGDDLFVKGASGDLGGYSSATNAANVSATLHDNGPSVFYSYEDYLVTQVPWIWLPAPDYQLTEVTSSLQGVTPQNAYLYLSPEDWSYSS